MHIRRTVRGVVVVALVALASGCSSSKQASDPIPVDAAEGGVIDPGVGGASGETGAAVMGGTTTPITPVETGGTITTTTGAASGGKTSKTAGTTAAAGAAGGKGSTSKVAGTAAGTIAAGGTTAAGGVGGTSAPPETCIGSTLLSALGKSTVLIGASMEDATATKAPFDGRYLYISGGYFDGAAPCTSCASGCTAAKASCANSGDGCAWWGCWQYDQDPPGQYAVGFINNNEKAKQIPMFTYYQELQASGLGEGAKQVAGINDATFLTRYFADWRFLLQRIGSHPALLHIEPDFWGYVEQANADPHAIPAKVSAANPTDCAGYEDSAAGFAKCLIHMVRLYAPKAKVGLHASAWGTNFDVFGNSSASLNLAGEAQKMVAFLTALGAKDGDFIVSDPSDRDAGYYQSVSRNTWWDATNAKLPNFKQAFAWTKAVAEGLNMPVILWQIPVGNMSQTNTTDHWQDNRLEYFFAHMDEVVAAHVVGLFFGAGMGGMTTPETDGGMLVAKTKAYADAGGTKICP